MSVLILLDQAEGHLRKSTPEILSYGAALAASLGTEANALVLGKVNDDLAALGQYGVSNIYNDGNSLLDTGDAQVLSTAIVAAAAQLVAETVLFASSPITAAIAPRVAAALQAGYVSGIIGLPRTDNGFEVKRTVFSGKAFAWVKINSAAKVLSLSGNSFEVNTTEATATVHAIALPAAPSSLSIVSTEKVEGDVPLEEAAIVVSGGRGLKGPENWNLIDDLATALHAAHACSRPVSDSGWRPHHEHVGQTGKQIAPNLYIAAGISGAIQHIGGINRSKVIVAINKDPEAPIFKAADYGIVGDVFEVLPRLTEAVKKAKG